jgi:FtsP/CotA-like multicopper oxidase with cupredoxin domain
MKRLAVLAAVLLVLPRVSHRVFGIEPTLAEQIAANDNRKGAGTLADGVLMIRLEARGGEWHPDGDDNPGIHLSAFGVEGAPLQIPGPLIRVREGTEIHASVRNRLETALVVHGFYARPAKSDTDANPLTIAAGDTRDIVFQAGEPGTYYYWAAGDAAQAITPRPGSVTQLSGAFIVDPADAAPSRDRVLVITGWLNGARARSPEQRARIAINGQSWPHTERLTYSVGDVVRMRVLNLSGAVHPMHLHGFYFNVDSRGTERVDTIFPADSSPHLVVTERTFPGSTYSFTWKPTRPGNWLFHCHDTLHVTYSGALEGDTHHRSTDMMDMMAGPVIGITVTGKSVERIVASRSRRQLRLVARVDDGGSDQEPAFGYTLEGSRTTTAKPYLPAPTIVLRRGEPVSITVVNHLPVSTSVHWHGIELESYYDGVAGFAGEGNRIAPPIQPGASFEARFTPPRSGTFIYHTHLDDLKQQQAGLTGALLVVDDPAKHDPQHDLVMLVTTPRKAADDNMVLLNGTSTPARRTMHVGEHYRLRFINVHVSRPSMRMRLLNGEHLSKWRSIAKDGMDLPSDQVSELASEIQMGNGETYDFDFVPTERGTLRLDVTAANGTLLTSMPIQVVDAATSARVR